MYVYEDIALVSVGYRECRNTGFSLTCLPPESKKGSPAEARLPFYVCLQWHWLFALAGAPTAAFLFVREPDLAVLRPGLHLHVVNGANLGAAGAFGVGFSVIAVPIRAIVALGLAIASIAVATWAEGEVIAGRAANLEQVVMAPCAFTSSSLPESALMVIWQIKPSGEV